MFNMNQNVCLVLSTEFIVNQMNDIFKTYLRDCGAH